MKQIVKWVKFALVFSAIVVGGKIAHAISSEYFAGRSEPLYSSTIVANAHGVRITAISTAKDQTACRAQSEAFYKAISVDCPACRQERADCLADLGMYDAVWEMKHFEAPYVSAAKTRYVLTGAPQAELELTCSNFAKRLRTKLPDARCIK